MVEKLLKFRSEVKKRKPTFRRQQSNQFAKFKNDDRWRRPKGYQSKMRLKEAGHRRMPATGYKSPRLVRGLNRDGFKEVLVYNVADLMKIDSKTEIAIIARTVGGRKSLDILNKAKELNMSFGNVFGIDKRISELTKTPKKKVEKKTEAVKTEKKAEPKKEEAEK